MSASYSDLTETSFPSSVDTISRMSDLEAEDMAAVEQYYAYYDDGNLDAAATVIENNPSLQNKIFNAAKFNKLIDALIAVERFFRTDAYAYKGEYSASTAYVVGNIVFVTAHGCSYICKADCTGVSPTEGASSTNWGLISLKGEAGAQGQPGTGALASDTSPLMDSTASAGTSTAWSRGDHTHPSDTTKADVSHTHTMSDIASGTLPVSQGGTGATSLTAGAILTGGTNAVGSLSGTGAVYADVSGTPQFGTLPVADGGTGAATLASGGLVKANGTDAFTVVIGTGALYADTSGSPRFGTLPVTRGGTGNQIHSVNSVLLGNGENALQNINSNNGAFYATALNGQPLFGTLPIAQGGTGATTKAAARAALGITSGTTAPSGGENGDIYIQYA